MRRFLFLALVLAACQAQAGDPPFLGCNSVGCIGKIDRIFLHESGDIKIPPPGGSDGSHAQNVQCTLSDGTYFVLKRAHPSFSEIYSAILAAQVAGKLVFLRIEDGSPDCTVRYADIY
jgi:hypothetical protein